MTKDTTANDLVAMGYKPDATIKLSNQISELKKQIKRTRQELSKLEAYAKKANETRTKSYKLEEDLRQRQNQLSCIVGDLQNLNLMRTRPDVYGDPQLFLKHAKAADTKMERFVKIKRPAGAKYSTSE